MINQKRQDTFAKIGFIIAMTIFGAIGLVRKNIALSSSLLALSRGLVGGVILWLVVLFTKTTTTRGTLKKNIVFLLVSGALIGGDWVVFFEAMNYTSVATTTLCYYMAPIIVIVVSPILFKEKLTTQKVICIVCAFVGMVLVSGVLDVGIQSTSEITGVLLGLLSACFYAMIILLNKKIIGVPALLKTAIQLSMAGLIMIPYCLVFDDFSQFALDTNSIVYLAICCLISTGLAYVLYFNSMEHMKAQTVSILSYLDPLVSLVISFLILGESLTPLGIVGCVMILGSTILSEIDFRSLLRKNND